MDTMRTYQCNIMDLEHTPITIRVAATEVFDGLAQGRIVSSSKPMLHVAGSWYHNDEYLAHRKTFEDMGYDIPLNHVSEAHTSKSKEEQNTALIDSMYTADVCFFDFGNMEDRTSSSTFIQFEQAYALHHILRTRQGVNKPIVVLDPAKKTREPNNHPFFNNVSGRCLTGEPVFLPRMTEQTEQTWKARHPSPTIHEPLPAVSWVDSAQEAMDLLKLHMDHHIPTNPTPSEP